MKGIIQEYGRMLIFVLAGTLVLAMLGGGILSRIRQNAMIYPRTESRKEVSNGKSRVPKLLGLEKDGKPIALKITAGTVFDPIKTEGIIDVCAEDPVEGDITRRIEVYIVEDDETKTLMAGTLDTSGERKHYILSYEVENEAGYGTAKKISVLITGKEAKE